MKNKKLIISLFSLCLVAIVGLLTTVIVLAAGSQSVKSDITISYTATDIQGEVSMSYQVAEDTSTTLGTFKFEDNGTTTGTIGSSSPELKSDKKYVVYTITLKAENDTSYEAKLTQTISNSNLKVYYAVDSGEFSETNPTGTTAVQVTGGTEKVLKVKYEIVNTAKDISSATGSISLTLKKSFSD